MENKLPRIQLVPLRKSSRYLSSDVSEIFVLGTLNSLWTNLKKNHFDQSQNELY